MRTICLLLITSFLFGCHYPPPPSQEEILAERNQQLAMLTRFYKGKTSEQVIVACDKLFRLADPSAKIQHKGNGLFIVREKIRMHEWEIICNEEPEGTRVLVNSFEAGQATGKVILSKPLYETFFARLDHLLGIRNGWIDCKEAMALAGGFERDPIHGNVEPLCEMSADLRP